MARILVVDDDPMITMLLRSVLEGAGHNVTEASNGKEATKLYHQNPSDLIILDLVMPEKEGIETIMELRSDFPDVKIIAITGGLKGQSEVLLTAAKDLGASHTFKKPLNSKEILEATEKIINGKMI